MPLIQGRKRQQPAEDENPESSTEPSPEPATQRRRTENEPDTDERYGDDDGTTDDNSLDQMVKKLVRLALACEYQRRPIRRADISEKVLGTVGSRHFKAVFHAAQMKLHTVFGMTMVELPAREKVTLQQKRAAAVKAASTQGQSTKTGSAAWVLTSTLPSEYHNPEIRLPPAAPTNEEDGKYTAIYSVLVSLVSLSGGQLPDAKMERYLQRLGMQDNTPIDGYDKTEKLLKRLEREQYLVKIKESGGGQEQDVYWTVGPRGKVEVGNDGVRGLVKAVYGVEEEDEEEELEKRLRRSLAIPEATLNHTDPGGLLGTSATQQRRPGRPRRREQDNQPDENDDDGNDDEDSD